MLINFILAATLTLKNNNTICEDYSADCQKIFEAIDKKCDNLTFFGAAIIHQCPKTCNLCKQNDEVYNNKDDEINQYLNVQVNKSFIPSKNNTQSNSIIQTSVKGEKNRHGKHKKLRNSYSNSRSYSNEFRPSYKSAFGHNKYSRNEKYDNRFGNSTSSNNKNAKNKKTKNRNQFSLQIQTNRNNATSSTENKKNLISNIFDLFIIQKPKPSDKSKKNEEQTQTVINLETIATAPKLLENNSQIKNKLNTTRIDIQVITPTKNKENKNKENDLFSFALNLQNLFSNINPKKINHKTNNNNDAVIDSKSSLKVINSSRLSKALVQPSIKTTTFKNNDKTIQTTEETIILANSVEALYKKSHKKERKLSSKPADSNSKNYNKSIRDSIKNISNFISSQTNSKSINDDKVSNEKLYENDEE